MKSILPLILFAVFSPLLVNGSLRGNSESIKSLRRLEENKQQILKLFTSNDKILDLFGFSKGSYYPSRGIFAGVGFAVNLDKVFNSFELKLPDEP